MFWCKRLLGEISLFPLLKNFKGYSSESLKNDLFASLTVAFMTMPQAIAYSLLAGLPPIAGLLSAVFGTLFTGVFSSSRHLVSGPSTGVAILIQTAIADAMNTYYGGMVGMEKEAMILTILSQIVLFVGIFQLLFVLLKFGKALEFVSRSVIMGYFCGVALAIVVNQLFYFLGVESPSTPRPLIFKLFYLVSNIASVRVATLAVGMFSLGLLYFLKRFKKLPVHLLMLAIATCVAYFVNKYTSFSIASFSSIGEIGETKITLSFPVFNFEILSYLFPSLVAISLLSILEVFSISRGLSALSGQNVVPAQDNLGIGISNAILGFLPGAMPASGSYTRSMLNWQSGAKTSVAAIFSSLLVALFAFVFWNFIKEVPLAALAALLFMMVPALLDIEQFKLCFKTTKGDALAFSLTVFSCLVFTLEIAFFFGIVISIISYLKKASVPHLVEFDFDGKGRLAIVQQGFEVHRTIRIIGIGGELFFAAAGLFQNTMRAVADDPHVRAIVLRLNGVYHVDASMCFTILKLYEYLKATKRNLVICSVTDEVWEVFAKSGIVEKIGSQNIFLTDEIRPQLSTWRAYQRAEELI